jgi:hypothetical protein
LVANILAELKTLSDEKKRDLKILEACVCSYDKAFLRVLIKHLFLSRDQQLQNAMQNLRVDFIVKDELHRHAWLEVCIDKLNAIDFKRLSDAFRNLMFIVKASSSKGSFLPIFNSYIKTEISIDKLLKLLPTLMNGSMSETVMTDLLASVDNDYQHQTALTAKRPGAVI